VGYLLKPNPLDFKRSLPVPELLTNTFDFLTVRITVSDFFPKKSAFLTQSFIKFEPGEQALLFFSPES
jgi:hypothetical protein